jgi:hypothetical protein
MFTGGLVYFLGSSSLPRYHVHRFFVFIHIHFLYENKAYGCAPKVNARRGKA